MAKGRELCSWAAVCVGQRKHAKVGLLYVRAGVYRAPSSLTPRLGAVVLVRAAAHRVGTWKLALGRLCRFLVGLVQARPGYCRRCASGSRRTLATISRASEPGREGALDSRCWG